MREIAVCVGKTVSIRRNVVCSFCKRDILTDEKYYRTGHNVRRGERGYGIRTFCVNCINKMYVDGEK
jgi:hypothetical protein